MKTFVICGYGIPEDIQKDKNYQTYLHIVFNEIYTLAKNGPALIIPGGGPTSCTPPYTGTEAEVIAEYIETLMHREIVKGATETWRIVPEKTSLSSLENLLFAKHIAEQEGATEVMIFCEATRAKRNREVAEKLFKSIPVSIEGIDFDISKNRYLPDDLIEKKERIEREHADWALQSQENLAKHHAFFEEKFRSLRAWQSEGMSHVDAVTRWYDEGAKKLEDLQK